LVLFTTLFPPTAQNLDTKVYDHTASLLNVSTFSTIFREITDKGKHNTD
jgi:hypothetical protein